MQQVNKNLKPGIDFTGVLISLWCIDQNGNILLQKRSMNVSDNPGKWDFGFGQLKFGEGLESAVERIMLKEYDCKGQILTQLPAIADSQESMGIVRHWLITPFVIKVRPEEVKTSQPIKIDELSWFELHNLPQPLHPAAEASFKKYMEMLRTVIMQDQTAKS